MSGHVLLDLGDFTPETYLVRFSINGNNYAVQYQEARVDEVLDLLAEAETAQDKPKAELARSRRRYLAELFGRNLHVGDKDQLAKDLELVPYASLRGDMDIYGLYMHVQNRVKKKALNGPQPVQVPVRRGFLDRLRFW